MRLALWVIVLGGLCGGLAWYLLREPVIEVTADTVRRGAVEETIAAISSGAVMPQERSMVAAGMMGRIAAVHVSEGERVKSGDLLVELEHEELDAQVALARANLAAARPRLEQARIAAGIQQEVSGTQLSQTLAQLSQAEADYNRLKALAANDAISQSELDRAALALRVAREAHAAAGAGQRESLVRTEDIKAAELGIAQLEAAVAVAEAMREKAFVRAPIDGVAAEVLVKKGEAVALGLPLVQVVNDAALHVEAPFDEANAAKIKAGFAARIEVDAFPGEEFPGEVTYIAPVVSMNRDLSRTIKVKVRVTRGAERLLAGMSADVTLIAQTKEGVLYVPSESLIRDELAYVIQGGRVVERRVQAGIGNWEHREIVSGLSEGEQFVTSVAAKGLKPGVRVRVVESLDV